MESPEGYIIAEGSWIDDELYGLSRFFQYPKQEQGITMVYSQCQVEPNGFGMRITSFKETYIGDLKNSEMCGIGKITYQNGQTYTGEFKNDKTNGKGILQQPDGTILKGFFVDNEFSYAYDFDEAELK